MTALQVLKLNRNLLFRILPSIISDFFVMKMKFPIGWCISTSNSDIKIPLYKGKVLAFGRQEPDNNNTRVTRVQLDNSYISATHCYIWMVQFDSRTACVCYFKDVSTNSCYLNAEKVGYNNFRILKNGDKIKMCDGVIFRFITNDYLMKENLDSLEMEIKVQDWIIRPEIIGIGSFGKVQIAHHEKNKINFVAVKSTVLNQRNTKNELEYMILSKLSHPNIIQIKGMVMDTQNEYLRIFQDLAIGGDLFSYLSQDSEVLQKIPECEAIFCLYQICNALSYLHSKGVVHRDLKLDNILIMGVPVKYPHLVIGDFGIAKQHFPFNVSQNGISQKDLIFRELDLNGSDENCQVEILTSITNGEDDKLSDFLKARHGGNFWMNTMVGTAEYAAPEINLSHRTKYQNLKDITSNREDQGRFYNEKIDSWSLGVVAHILLSGVSPFYSNSLEENITKRKYGILFLSSDKWEGVSAESKRIIRGLLQVDSKRRLSINDCLASSIFTGRSKSGIRRHLLKQLSSKTPY